MKLGVYGHGPQSKRYLDPANWPDGVEVVQLGREQLDRSVAGCIVANAPNYHAFTMGRAMGYGLAVLAEKPMHTEDLWPGTLKAALSVSKRPFMVAHTHLWASDFLALHPSKTAMVQWCGEERSDGSCPAMLDWGPHAWSMAIALGTDRVITGKGDRTKNVVKSRGKEYRGCTDPNERPMKAMLETFASLIDGGYDWRAEPDFALEVHRRCFTASGSTRRSDTSTR